MLYLNYFQLKRVKGFCLLVFLLFLTNFYLIRAEKPERIGRNAIELAALSASQQEAIGKVIPQARWAGTGCSTCKASVFSPPPAISISKPSERVHFTPKTKVRIVRLNPSKQAEDEPNSSSFTTSSGIPSSIDPIGIGFHGILPSWANLYVRVAGPRSRISDLYLRIKDTPVALTPSYSNPTKGKQAAATGLFPVRAVPYPSQILYPSASNTDTPSAEGRPTDATDPIASPGSCSDGKTTMSKNSGKQTASTCEEDSNYTPPLVGSLVSPNYSMSSKKQSSNPPQNEQTERQSEEEGTEKEGNLNGPDEEEPQDNGSSSTDETADDSNPTVDSNNSTSVANAIIPNASDNANDNGDNLNTNETAEGGKKQKDNDGSSNQEDNDGSSNQEDNDGSSNQADNDADKDEDDDDENVPPFTQIVDTGNAPTRTYGPLQSINWFASAPYGQMVDFADVEYHRSPIDDNLPLDDNSIVIPSMYYYGGFEQETSGPWSGWGDWPHPYPVGNGGRILGYPTLAY